MFISFRGLWCLFDFDAATVLIIGKRLAARLFKGLTFTHVHLVMCGRFNFCINYVVKESVSSRHCILITLSCVYFFF